MQRTSLSPDLDTCRLLNGMWQVSGAHGSIDPVRAVAQMHDYHDAGFTTWDLADHYGPAEDFVGMFRDELEQRRGAAALDGVQAFTKWVPSPGPMTREIVAQNVDRARRRMHVEVLDMMQFHWWDYHDERYLEALEHLAALRDDGVIRELALTNFDTAHVERILAAGVPVVSNQVQYSLVDLRPQVAMAPMCVAQSVGLLTYGTLAGGFLSDRYLDRPEPGSGELETVSLRKYKQMIDAWGGWPLLQTLLGELNDIAIKHGVTIANVATAAILQRPGVAGVIVGARLGVSEHRDENAAAVDLALDEEDDARIKAVLGDCVELYEVIGDCGDEYR